MAGFWSGFAKGLSDELDRGQRRKEFEETLNQRRLETLATVAANRQASSIEEYDPFADTPEEVMGAPEEVTEEVGVVSTPTEVAGEDAGAPPPGEEEGDAYVAAPETPTAYSPALPKDAGAYAKALVLLGASPDKVAELAARGGSRGLKLTYEAVIKGTPKTGWSGPLMDEVLDSVIFDVRRGSRPDLQKLWGNLYPDADPLSGKDQRYVETLLGAPGSSIDVLIPGLETMTPPKEVKPLTQTEKDNVREQMEKEVGQRVQAEIFNLRKIIADKSAANEDVSMEVAKVGELELAATGIKDYNDIGGALRALGEEAGDQIFAGYFESYPGLDERFYIGVNLEPYLKRYQERNSGSALTSPTASDPVEPALEEPSNGSQVRGYPTVNSEEEAQTMINSGQLKVGDFFILNGQVQIVQ